MTREEKVNLLNALLGIEEKNDIGNLTRAERVEFQQWVKGLEQDSVIDKIRAEIAEIPKKYPMTMDYENGLKEAIGIIDKYKAESEG